MGAILLLTLAGAASGLLAMLIDTTALESRTSFGIVGAAYGIVLAGYLWFHEGERAPGRLVSMVLGTLAAMCVTLFFGFAMVLVAMMAGGQPAFALILGPVLAGAGGAWVLSSIYLRLLRSPHDRLRSEVVWMTLSGIVLGPVGAFGALVVQSTATAAVIWQGGMACALGIAAHTRHGKR